MSETAPEVAPAATANPTEPAPASTAPETPATDAPTELPSDLGDAGKAAIDRMKAERDAARREAKSNADKAKEFDAYQESQKTEQQKIADRATAAERERDEAKADGLRYKAAAKHGVNEDNFDLLGSGDEEAIQARAERVGGFLKLAAENEQLKVENEALKAGKPVPSGGRPTEQLRPGATPTTPGSPTDSSYPSSWLPAG